MRPLIRRPVRRLVPYEPPPPLDQLEAEIGRDVLRLSANESPIGPSPLAVAAIRDEAQRAHLYPDGSAHALRAALAGQLGVSPDHLLFGNGADELIGFVARASLGPRDEVVVPHPAFEPYESAAQIMGAATIRSPLRDYHIDLSDFLTKVTKRTKIVFLANPHNPTGTIVSKREFEAFLDALAPEPLLVVDEAYWEFADDPEFPAGTEFLARRPRLLILRTFSKIAGLAGLLQFSRLSVGDPTVAVGLELDVIAAVIIGGGSLAGGRGTIAGSLIGAAIMTIISIGCSQKGLANWVQQIVINQWGPDVYDQWVAHGIPYNDDRIKQSWQMFGDIILNPDYILGGTDKALATRFSEGAIPLFKDPPEAYMHVMGSFDSAFITNPELGFPEGLVAGEDFDFFPFPVINPDFPSGVTGDLNMMMMFNNDPETCSFVEWMASADAQDIWVGLGGFTSLNTKIDLNAYPTALDRKVGEILANPNAVFRPDADDAMPSGVGGDNGAVFTGVLDFIDGGNLDTILKGIEDVFP